MKRAPAAFGGGHSAAVIALILAQACFVAAYVGHEHTFYFWDHAMYFAMARQAYAAFGQSFAAGWDIFHRSLANDYNFIFTLPSLAAFPLFGATRAVFIVTNYFAFFLAYEVAVAFLLKGALGWRGDTALLASLVVNSLIPPLWLPLLEGYPDSGAAACLVFAAAIGWSGAAGKNQIRRALGLGVMLALAVLLRRHFVYAALALLATLGLFELWRIRHTEKRRGAAIKQAAIYFAVTGFGFAAALALIAPDFVRTAFTTDYGQLYFSYHRPAGTFLYFLLGGFGYGLLLLAAAGLWLLARDDKGGGKSDGPKLAAFAVLYLTLWLVIWCGGPDQMGHHYVLHALPLAVAVGLAGWAAHWAGRPARRRYALGGLMLAALVANSAWALWLSPIGVPPNDNGRPGLLSAARPPVVRPDYGELQRLALYLQQTTTRDDRLMMVGSSFVLNLDLLNSAAASMPESRDLIARFYKNPEIDHEEPAPLDIFASADVYVVPAPPQYHLEPSGQRVITAAANQFPPPAARAALFHADDEVFHLAGGVNVTIWRRDAWTPQALHDALGEIRRDGPDDARFAQDWAAIVLPARASIATAAGATAVSALLAADRRALGLFFDTPLAPGAQQLTFSYAGNCPAPQFSVVLRKPDGAAVSRKPIPTAPLSGAAVYPLDVPADGARYLELHLATAAMAMCRMELRGLKVEKAP
jgi:hypothetical protein